MAEVQHSLAAVLLRYGLTLGASLYTNSRLLAVLGDAQYGAFTTVLSTASLFTFVLTTATGTAVRFSIKCEATKSVNFQLHDSLKLHLTGAAIVILLGESIGYAIFKRLVQTAPHQVQLSTLHYQISLVSALATASSGVYSAILTGRQQFQKLAALTTTESLAKAALVNLLPRNDTSNLLIWPLLTASTSLMVTALGFLLSRSSTSTFALPTPPRSRTRDLYLFASWSLLGNAAGLVANQSLNIIAATSLSYTATAARAIGQQASSSASGLFSAAQSLLTGNLFSLLEHANQPERTRAVAIRMQLTAVLVGSTILPAILNAKPILELWLEHPPPQASTATSLCLIQAFFELLSWPLIASAQAAGRMAAYQICVSASVLSAIPLTHFLITLHRDLESVLAAGVAANIIALSIRAIVLNHNKFLSVRLLVNHFLCRTVPILVLSSTPTLILSKLLPPAASVAVVSLALNLSTVVAWIAISPAVRSTIAGRKS